MMVITLPIYTGLSIDKILRMVQVNRCLVITLVWIIFGLVATCKSDRGRSVIRKHHSCRVVSVQISILLLRVVSHLPRLSFLLSRLSVLPSVQWLCIRMDWAWRWILFLQRWGFTAILCGWVISYDWADLRQDLILFLFKSLRVIMLNAHWLIIIMWLIKILVVIGDNLNSGEIYGFIWFFICSLIFVVALSWFNSLDVVRVGCGWQLAN